ncbi:[protein-PII] uridylyltransferase [Moraxella caviae]|uniref:Bifunctional uridylyltransferase/uridylyl-removing enzyme n=1 Tax=Moraxella caviae TaxID=34060 RepID=A0A1T0A589_9GAMM|nr:[protein-PII] uridylyltransferase [Moraxella caviae]OOR90840.1 [protein-PII] uridylyltransferase [Moraxella caviae]STZ10674.1 PII uridylyl-transferase [Moraxella caviae]
MTLASTSSFELANELAAQLGLSVPALPKSAAPSSDAEFEKFLAAFDGSAYQAWLGQINADIDARMVVLGRMATQEIAQLIALRTAAMDALMVALFTAFGLPDELALFAVGGYGRGELLPNSDVDLLLIGKDITRHQARIEPFVARLWDIGITPAISVRTLDDTALVISDQTIATALLEARFLTGNHALAHTPKQAVKNHWTAKAFFDAKTQEAKERYRTQGATEYNLEPNIKSAPGALRDIHVVMWLGKFVFDDVRDLADLAAAGFLSDDKAITLTNAQLFLWCMRHHLHALTGRAEERLLFDHQKSLAVRMGYADENVAHSELTSALEAMMRLYYRHAMHVAALSELSCDYFNERYLNPVFERVPLDDDFYRLREIGSTNPQTDQNDKIAAIDDTLFIKKPDALLRIFLMMGKHGIKKIAASTLRALFLASNHINDEYRDNPAHRALFLANLQEGNYLFHRLRLMKRYGVLANYLPAFGDIMGLMQYDLFHRYTVDAHTLLLVRILHRFGKKDESHTLPSTDNSGAPNPTSENRFGLVSEVYQNINRKDILVIAALFHDIAKGRGGDHSELGAQDAYEFCQAHKLSQQDTDLVCWLVKEHLTMSLTAQKQDIYDPEVIARFAEFTGSITRLNHLYALTVADMNATNSQLWNAWRASLLRQLYISTHRVLSLGLAAADKDQVIANRKHKAKLLLDEFDQAALDALWAGFGEDFFLKQKHADIAWQSAQILRHTQTHSSGTPIIALREHGDVALGAVQLLVCNQDQDDLFAATVCTLDGMGLSVLDATILTGKIDGVPVAIDSYVLLDRLAIKGSERNDILTDSHRQTLLIQKLATALRTNDYRTPPRTFGQSELKHFSVPTQISFQAATSIANDGHHAMMLITKDRPALLAKVGGVFRKLRIEVHGARITTLGERAEDMFHISAKDGRTLSDDELATLKAQLLEVLG